MKKAANKNGVIDGLSEILQDYRDVLPFQDRVILNRKFGRQGVASQATTEVVRDLDCNWADVGIAMQKLIHILRVKNKWLIAQAAKLTEADEEGNVAIIAWLNGQRKANGQMASRLCALRDEEKKTEEKAHQEWRARRAR